MANPEHVAILKPQGGHAWNRWNVWRKEHHDILPDLSGVDLSRDVLDSALREDLHNRVMRGELTLIGREPDANLNGTNLSRADLRQTDLNEVSLRGADLSYADLSMANLTMANLNQANLHGADLRKADLSHASLLQAGLTEADLRWADLRNTDLRWAKVGWTVFGGNDLSRAKGLETIHHLAPSSVGIDTIYKSGGKIPEVFLRGAGVPDNFIDYFGSVVGRSIEFYSCFISYSSKDQKFAKRLHADLQHKGVRCWFAPEDLKIGEKFRTRIDESIRLYDKLMVVLTQNSIASPWVEEEVETALEKERQQRKLVLFPIRLDDAVMDTDQAWATSLRRIRHIGDFTHWKKHDSYQKALGRLLRDLKAESTLPAKG